MKISTSILAGAVVLATQLSCAKTVPTPKEAPGGINLETQLLEAGAEPVELLRYNRPQHLTEDLVMQFGLASLLESAEASALVATPVVSLGMTAGPVKCDAGTVQAEHAMLTPGDDVLCTYPVRFRVIELDVPEGTTPEQQAAFTDAVAPLGKITGTFSVDQRGVTRRTDVDVPPGISPRLLTMLGNIRTSLVSVPLPNEAIGVGARWKVERLHRVGEIQTTQTITYSLLERKDRVLRLAVTLQQTAAPQEVPFEGAIKFKVESYEVSGTGSMVMSLDGITPLSEIRATSNLRGNLTDGTKTEPLAVAGSLELVVGPLAPETATK